MQVDTQNAQQQKSQNTQLPKGRGKGGGGGIGTVPTGDIQYPGIAELEIL